MADTRRGAWVGYSMPMVSPELLRIVGALVHRSRYRYVQPVVVPWRESNREGWKIVSPNCSRNIDSGGGEIAIAWLQRECATPPQGCAEAAEDQRWHLHARDHARNAWRLLGTGLSLDTALEHICTDPRREFWP